jgi:hypothetical protein
MNRLLLVFATAWAVTLTSPADEDAYALKLYTPKEGDVTKLTFRQKTGATVEEVSYTDEILSQKANAKRLTKLRRTIHSMTRTDAQGKKTDGPLAGKTLVSEMLPSKPVKVGETWSQDKKKVLASMKGLLLDGTVVDEEKMSFLGKLVRAEKKDGGLYGTIELTSTLPVKKYQLDEQTILNADAGSVVTLQEVLTCRLDGGSPDCRYERVFSVAVKAKVPDGKVEVKVIVTTTGTEESVPQAKK